MSTSCYQLTDPDGMESLVDSVCVWELNLDPVTLVCNVARRRATLTIQPRKRTVASHLHVESEIANVPKILQDEFKKPEVYNVVRS
jgi:hypothetical protein